MKGCTALLTLFCALFLLFCLGCKKFGKTNDVYFYIDSSNLPKPLMLILDNKTVGELPVVNARISPDNDTILDHALHLQLKGGKYRLSVRDNSGQVRCSGTMIIRKTSVGGATDPGTLEYAKSKDILVVKVFCE